MSIQKVRQLFSKAKGEEEKIAGLLRKILQDLDRKKNGTVIGKKRKLDYEKVVKYAKFPNRGMSETKVVDELVKLYEGVNLWAHPQTQVNVVPPPTNLSIAAAALAARFNENSIWDHYGVSAAVSEVQAIAMLSDLIGYNKQKAGGIFTFGGTGCNLYAARMGIEKADPDAKRTGIRDRIKFFCSDTSHYSILSAGIWTGIGSENVVKIRTTDDNRMDVKDLEKHMKKAIKDKCRIGCVFATLGTTDAFGIDPLQEIIQVRDKLQKQVKYKIHVHADAVIGWPYLTFKKSSLLSKLSQQLQKEISAITQHIAEVNLADSVGIDFHKTGWSSYLCSAIVVKDQKDLLLLKKFKKDMPYLYHDKGYQPGCFTLESSRPNYAQKALVNMLAFGKEGYESLIISLLQSADYLREILIKSEDIAVMNRNNPAFVTDFRMYPKNKIKNGESLFEQELHDKVPKAFTEKINKYNQAIAHKVIEHAESKGTSLISYTDSYRTTQKGRHLVALKSYPMSPFTEKMHMNILLKDLYAAKKAVDRNWK
jgi:L-2,4-diaminobutyrate decarboxylase